LWGGRSVFISYRRQLSWQLAKLVRDNLAEHDFDTFVDVKNLDGGGFDRTILSQIEAREHFIVLLEPNSLDRIGEKGDWLRREIAHALAHGRNVVPVTANGFEFRSDLALPHDVARLPSFNAVAIQPEYFNAAMKLLRKRFLKTPSRPAAPSLPETRSASVPGLAAAIPERFWSTRFTVQDLPAPQLTGPERRTSGSVWLTWSEVSGAQEYVLEQATGFITSGEQHRFVEVYRGPNRSYLARPGGVWSAGPTTTGSEPAAPAGLGSGATLCTFDDLIG
jgi:hypothetical protein